MSINIFKFCNKLFCAFDHKTDLGLTNNKNNFTGMQSSSSKISLSDDFKIKLSNKSNNFG